MERPGKGVKSARLDLRMTQAEYEAILAAAEIEAAPEEKATDAIRRVLRTWARKVLKRRGQ